MIVNGNEWPVPGDIELAKAAVEKALKGSAMDVSDVFNDWYKRVGWKRLGRMLTGRDSEGRRGTRGSPVTTHKMTDEEKEHYGVP